jgi:16S rRNA (guanine(966)-N(2))-methyltransferase RsmD
MRVISGSAKGRALKPAGAATRPITDRVKESLFDILSARVIDANVRDLFAGAGSVGIEALSRGARAATFVELDRDALRAIRANLDATRLMDRARVVRLDVFKFIRHNGGIIASRNPSTPLRSAQDAFLAMTQYDLIYVAPPQYKGLWAETLATLDKSALLAPRGIVVAQIHPKEYKELALTQLELFDQRKYGSTVLCFYRRRDA